MNTFFVDHSRNVYISYEQLVEDINSSTSYFKFFRSDNFYEIFKSIILAFVHNREICLLDSDFSDTEIKNLLGENDENLIVEFKAMSFKNFNEIIDYLKINNRGKISLFTSGTTGLPKKITHTFENISRNCKVCLNRLNDIWGFAYNPTHMAGIQVFLQALLNHNTIVNLFNLNRSLIFDSILKYKITNISATPTFFRLLLPVEKACQSVIQITSGGEKFNSNLFDQISKIFPRSKILNIYASTEAGSIFASAGEFFSIGRKYIDFVKIQEGEIFLHKNILGSGTENKLIGDWYSTGDLVEIVCESPLKFRFLSRKNEMINVGGYKVNPNEVEEAILSYRGIVEARVFGKSSSILGNIVCADVVTSEKVNVIEVRSFLTAKLQEYKIPRLINFVDQVKKTRTGKKKR